MTAEQWARDILMAKDLDQRRVTTLAKCGLLLSKMAGDGLEVGDIPTTEIYDEVLMALAIEDQECPDIWLDELLRDPSCSLLCERLSPPTDALRAAIEECAKVADDEAEYRRQCKAAAIDRKAKGEARDFESMAIACVQVAFAIRSLADRVGQ